MSSRRLPLLLALCVALFAGFVPLRECLASETGEQSVVALGTHAHGHAAHDGIDVEVDADCAAHAHDSGHDESGCCVDAPFAAGVRIDAISADRTVAASQDVAPSSIAFLSLALASLDALTADVSTADPDRAPAPPTVRTPVPTGVRSVVLLR